jgi:hypothetical protein
MMKHLLVSMEFLIVSFTLRADDFTSRYDRELFAVVRWEILWGELPGGASLPSRGGATKFAVQLATNKLSYCSHDLGVCETYRIEGYRNWQEVTSILCNDKRSDKEALLAFVNNSPARLVEGGHSVRYGSKGGGFTGGPVERSVITWTTETTLGSLPEIIKQYKRMHPPELKSLEHWLRTPPSADPGKRIKIACFAPTDPEVYLSVTAPGREPVIATIFWNRDAGMWESADGVGPPEDPAAVSRIRETIDSISCASIVF